MLRIGCTGAIGAGKSTVAAMLAARGAEVLDADEFARAALAPGSEALGEVEARFGPGILSDSGAVDREALADIVFSDEEARVDLEAIVHPRVIAALMKRLEEPRAADAVVVLDLPLLVETGGRERYGLDGVLVVEATPELCVDRLVARRGMTEEQARARLSAQAPRDKRLRAADFIILNLGSLDELEQMAAGAWQWIERLGEEKEED